MKKKASKRVVCILVAAVILVVLLGAYVWSVQSGPVLVPKQATYPEGTTSVTATFKHIWPNTYYTGEEYVLERADGAGQWTLVQWDERGAFWHDIGFELGSIRSDFTFDITKFCDSLTKGTYRIRKTIEDETGKEIEVSFTFDVQ